MKTIGIKLADGSFYPVLEDNTPSEKKLELTTAHNNQTKVMVDLYRSASCSMDDAEYVDSLQIENLNARPNGEPEIKFTVSLDEDNQLSAKIVDSETGNESDTTITLVSRTLEERLVTDEYDINDTEEKSDSKAGAVAAGALAAGGLLAAAAALRDKEAQNEAAETESENEPVIESEAEPEAESVPEPVAEEALVETVETVEEEAPVDDETFVEEPVVEEAEEENITEDEPVFDETPLEEPAEDFVIDQALVDEADDLVIDDAVAEEAADDTVIDEADAKEESEETMEESESTEDIAGELSDMDFDLPDDAENTVTEVSEDSEDSEAFESSEEEPLPDMDFDLPDDTDTSVTEVSEDSEPVESSEDFTPDETISEDSISADDTIADDSELPDMDFDLPDDSNNDEPVMPDDFFNTDDLDSAETQTDTQEDTMNDPLFDAETPVAGGLSFDGLYDEETERGTPAQNDEDDVKKKTKAPVIICIICAIICIIATLLILFIIPSKYNLITKKHAKETVAVEAPAPEPSPAPVVQAEPEPEPEPEPAVPEAKEDEIIIIEKAEEVVPAQPPVAEEKPKNITYKIKWGDTLWDIADTYYKNPWRYKYIARYNGIKNPDYIISGTIITIPAK